MSKQSLQTRIHESELHWTICRTVGYSGFGFRLLHEKMKPLIEQHGTRKVTYAIAELLNFTGWIVQLKPETRKACFTVLGPSPEQWDAHYRDWQGNPVKRPEEHETPPDVPPPQTDAFLESISRLTPEELVGKYKATTRWKTEDDRQAVLSEMLRRGIEAPKVEEPKEEAKATEAPTEEEPQQEPIIPHPKSEAELAGDSSQGYALFAKSASKRELAAMLQGARLRRKHYGDEFLGREAAKEIAAIEAEMRSRGIEVPIEGQETAKKRKKEELNKGA